MRILRRAPGFVVALGLALASLAAQAQDDSVPGESYHFQLQVRGLYLAPLNQHLPLDVDVDGAVLGELAGEWFFLPGWSTELAVSSPANLDLHGAGPGSIRLLTQTLTVKYYFPKAAVSGLIPYVGTGIYHSTSSRDGTAPDVGFGNAGFGWVLQGGFNYGLSENAFLSFDLRYLDNLEPTLYEGGASSGHLGVNPIEVGIGAGLRF